MDNKKARKKELKGEVVSTKMQDTVVVKVETRQPHPLYGKIVTTWKKYKAHTEKDYEVGDKVVIREISPISKYKKWIVIENLK